MKIFDVKFENQTILKNEGNKTNPVSIKPSYALFEHQIEVLNQTRKLLNGSLKRAVLHMPTGAGKTRTAINLICDHFKASKGSTVVWLAHTEELCQQASDEFNKAWNIIGNKKH